VILAVSPHIDEIKLDEARLRKRASVSPVDDLEAIEREHILSVLCKVNWVVSGRNGAAARLGLARSTLNFRMKRLGIFRSTGGSTESSDE